MNKTQILLILILVISQTTIYAENVKQNDSYPQDLNYINSNRKLIENAVIIPDSNPFFGIIGSYIACWYDKDNNSTGLLPLLVKQNERLSDNQEIFLNQYLNNKDKKILVLGEKLQSEFETTEILGSPPTVSI